jgi:hypothetical protein
MSAFPFIFVCGKVNHYRDQGLKYTALEIMFLLGAENKTFALLNDKFHACQLRDSYHFVITFDSR